MPATYEVHGGVAYPPRQKFTGEKCPECSFRGRHMSWCSRSKTAAPVPSPCRRCGAVGAAMRSTDTCEACASLLDAGVLWRRPAKVIPFRPSSTTAAPAKRRARGFDPAELSGTVAAHDYAWACGETPDADWGLRLWDADERKATMEERLAAKGTPEWRKKEIRAAYAKAEKEAARIEAKLSTEGRDAFRAKVKAAIEKGQRRRLEYLERCHPLRNLTPGGRPASPDFFAPGWERRR